MGGFAGGSLVARYRLRSPFSLEMRAGMAAAAYDERSFEEGNGWWNNKISFLMIPLELGAIATKPLGNEWSLHAGLGGGYYLIDAEFETSQGAYSETVDLDVDGSVGFYGLAGATYRLAPNASLFAEAKYTVLEASASTAGVSKELPFEEDVDLGGIALQLGALFSF